MLFSGVFLCGLFLSIPEFAAVGAGVAALPASPGQAPLVAAILRFAGEAEYSDRFFICGLRTTKGLTKKELEQVLKAIEAEKKKSKSTSN